MNPQISSPLWIFQGSQLGCGGGSPPSALPSPSQPWHSPVAEGFQFMVAFMALGNYSAIIQAEIKPSGGRVVTVTPLALPYPISCASPPSARGGGSGTLPRAAAGLGLCCCCVRSPSGSGAAVGFQFC